MRGSLSQAKIARRSGNRLGGVERVYPFYKHVYGIISNYHPHRQNELAAACKILEIVTFGLDSRLG
jgi:hypothetical protein